MEASTCCLCGAPLSEMEIRASQADVRVPDQQLFCELHRRRFSACSAVRQTPGKSR